MSIQELGTPLLETEELHQIIGGRDDMFPKKHHDGWWVPRGGGAGNIPANVFARQRCEILSMIQSVPSG